ncbi:thioesterase domain-containing protein [Tengunoibacter tsumagoiensis]|uniref:thioesterase domain-containing protein n=1 Tax=Tengunoibacter tsumagoiensis TaxID=2014871 RepID=UPI00248305F7|nr:thioesterase domain-containing protein [Tengunoibacter tsumagoiensis]
MPQSSVVTIQAAGKRPPFFCVHPVGGAVLCYAELAQRLGSDQPFYGLQAIGLFSDHDPHQSIEEMAAYYIEAMRAVQPQGPYHLGGWSLGGVIAFEMAIQLQRQQQEVGLLAIIDTSPPGQGDVPDFDQEMREIAQTMLHKLEGNGAIADDDWDDLSPEEQLLHFSTSAIQRRSQPWAHLAPEDQLSYIADKLRAAQLEHLAPALREIPQATSLLRVHRANYQALASYVPGQYAGRMILFHASDIQQSFTPSQAYLNMAEEWRKLLSDEHQLELHLVPGTHQTIITEPQVQHLAAGLRMSLESAQ